jgi:hypothetical protein
MGWFTGIYIPEFWAKAQPDRLRESQYLSKLEGRRGNLRTKGEHAKYLAEIEASKI